VRPPGSIYRGEQSPACPDLHAHGAAVAGESRLDALTQAGGDRWEIARVHGGGDTMLPLHRKFPPSGRKLTSCVLKLRLGAFQHLAPPRGVVTHMKPEPMVVLPQGSLNDAASRSLCVVPCQGYRIAPPLPKGARSAASVQLARPRQARTKQARGVDGQRPTLLRVQAARLKRSSEHSRTARSRAARRSACGYRR
jgi:hypothetical protein